MSETLLSMAALLYNTNLTSSLGGTIANGVRDSLS